MKRLLLVFLLTLMISPGASSQVETEDSVVFFSSNYNPIVTNVTAGSYVTIMFFARWNLTGNVFTGNDSIMVYFGADFSGEDQDWQLESDYNYTLDCFTVNFTYSKRSLITFYISEVLTNFRSIAFTQPAENVTILWLDEIITSGYNPFRELNEADLQFIGLLSLGFAGIVVVVVIYFQRQHIRYKEYQKEVKSRKRKMQDAAPNK